jgi:glycosyltransferase involved in cell wall biosynthesis
MSVDVSIVVPLFNEEESAGALHAEIADALADVPFSWELLAVDDGSTDGTLAALRRLADNDPRMTVVSLRRNFGQTAALSAGFETSQGEVLVPIDADLQNDPRDIPALVARLDQGFDVVSGWRKNRRDEAIRRRLPSAIANRLISAISGVRLHDYGCTLKAYRRSVVQDIRLYGEMHRFIPIYAKWQGARVTELVVNHRARRFGGSKYGLSRIPKVILDLLVVQFLFNYLTKPIYVFGGFAVFAFAGAFGAFGWALYYKLAHLKDFVSTPLPLLAALLGLTGLLSFLMGLLAEICVRTYFESQGRRPYVVQSVYRCDEDERRPGRSGPAPA